MVLQALGKSKFDYAPKSLENLKAIADTFRGKVEAMKRPGALDEMTFPDFLQVAVIEHYLNGDATPPAIAKARTKAAAKIIKVDCMLEMLIAFGAKPTERHHRRESTLTRFGDTSKRSDKRKGNSSGNRSKKKDDRNFAKQKETSDKMVTYGTPIRATYEQVKSLTEFAKRREPEFDKIEAGLQEARETLDELAAQNKGLAGSTTEALDAVAGYLAKKRLSAGQKRSRILRALKRAMRPLAKVKARHVEDYGAAASFEGMQERLPVDDYKAGFVPEVTAHLEGGGQVVLNLFDHYVRLQSMENDGFKIDDPGQMKSESFKVTWAEAIADGYFRKYFLVSS